MNFKFKLFLRMAKVAADTLVQRAREEKIRFPKIWDDSKIRIDCGKTLMMFKNEGGDFDIESALSHLAKTYGNDAGAVSHENKEGLEVAAVGDLDGEKKRKKNGTTDEDEKDENRIKKIPKLEVVACEANRGVAKAIHDMATLYFKNSDPRKGGVFSKAAKAIREAETEIKTAKEAMKLKGVGKGIAGYIEEFLEGGVITKLEELRAGVA